MPNARSMGVLAGGLLVSACLALAPPTAAIPAPIPPTEAVRVTSAGVVWRDEQRLVLLHGGVVTLAEGHTLQFDPALQASGRYAAVGATDAVLAGALPSPLRPIPRGAALAPARCDSWRADPAAGGQFAVGEGDLIVAGNPTCDRALPPAPRPLLAYSFARRRWRVLARLSSNDDPQLAASGRWVAVGATAVGPQPIHRAMRRVGALATRATASSAQTRTPTPRLASAARARPARVAAHRRPRHR